MRGYIRAVVMAVATLQAQIAWTQEDPRELYRQAAERIADAQYAQATQALESLLALNGDTQLAATARLALVECYLAERRFRQAYELLEDSEFCDFDPSLDDRILKLKIHAARGAALAAEEAGEYLAALQWLGKSPQLFEALQNPSDPWRSEYIRLAVLASRHPTASNDSLEAFVDSQPRELKSSIRFAIAEREFATGKLEKAAHLFAKLAESLSTESVPPAWAASVALRRAEILIRQHDYASASHLLRQSLEQYPDYEHRSEMHFLLARCAIANIEFEEAIEHLQLVLAAPVATPQDGDQYTNPYSDQAREARARAQWMVGEIRFLQRDYAAAIAAYSAVVDFGSELWSRRAMIQQAKCQELVGDQRAALASYRQVVQMSADSTEGVFARKRIAQIDLASTPVSSHTIKKR